MFDGVQYIVRFENGNYYSGKGLIPANEDETENIGLASLYVFDWAIQKDAHFRSYVASKGYQYKILKVKVTRVIKFVDEAEEDVCLSN